MVDRKPGRRDVVGEQSTVNSGSHRSHVLVLECGHTVVRYDRGTGLPKRTTCYKCEIIMDKLRLARNDGAGGWVMARSVGAVRKALLLLQKEGLVESATAPHNAAVHWRAAKDS